MQKALPSNGSEKWFGGTSDILLTLAVCRCKFLNPSDTRLSIPAAMVNLDRCEVVITEVQNNTMLEHVDVSDNHFDDNTGELQASLTSFSQC